jgi:tetratricopeptide (TPR) repeat protein
MPNDKSMCSLPHKSKYFMLLLFVAFTATAVATQPKTSSTPACAKIAPAAKTFEKQSVVLDSLYQTALVLLQQKNWYEASIVMERIWMQQPDYRNVIDHLAYARAQMCISGAGGSHSPISRHSLYRRGALTMLVALPLLAFLLLAPAPRAWFYALRGDYDAAARIYEKALARHPHRLSLYLTLANLYRPARSARQNGLCDDAAVASRLSPS